MEKKVKNIISKALKNPIVRSLILFGSGVVILMVATSLLLNIFTRHNKYIQVPKFTGLSMAEAEKLAAKDDLVLEISDSVYVNSSKPGEILIQIPAEGIEVKSGRRVFITINAYNKSTVEIPYVTNYSLRQAKNILQSVGLDISRLNYVQHMATNYVTKQQYKGKTIEPNSKLRAPIGDGVTLTVGVSKGKEMINVPRIVGYTLYEAKNRLWEAGINVGNIKFDKDVTPDMEKRARVYRQIPEQGDIIKLGDEVTLSLATDVDKVESGIKSSDAAAIELKESAMEMDSLMLDEKMIE